MFKFAQSGFFSCLLVFILSSLCQAQNRSNSIFGVVRNAETNEVLPGVNVFLDQTTIGAITDRNGEYHLNNLPDGTYDVVFSFVGFKQIKKKISFPRSYQSSIEIYLKPDRVVLDSVIVKDKYPREWLKNLKKFKEKFLGYSRNAEKTTILNPEILKFDTRDGNFKAYSKKPLELINEALGYKITLYLQSFIIQDGILLVTDATSQFALLEPKDQAQKEHWEKERERAYKGSFRHFIHSMVSRRLLEDGFRLLFIKKRKTYYSNNERPDWSLVHFGMRDEILVEKVTDYWNYRKLGQIELLLKDEYKYLKVVYLNEHPERSISMMMGIDIEYSVKMSQVSFIKFPKGSAIIDVNTGLGIPPYIPVTYGYWGWASNIPEWLPKDYKPESID